MIGDLALIYWRDSRSPDSTWNHVHCIEHLNSAPCLTVGWILSEDEDSIRIAQSLADMEDEDCMMQATGISTIYRGAIVEMTKLILGEQI